MMIQAPKSSPLHAVSLFSGIGLLDLGLHRAGIETRIFCESDRAARGFLARRLVDVDAQIRGEVGARCTA